MGRSENGLDMLCARIQESMTACVDNTITRVLVERMMAGCVACFPLGCWRIGQRQFKVCIVDKMVAVAAGSFVIPRGTHLFTYGQGWPRPWAPDSKERPLSWAHVGCRCGWGLASNSRGRVELRPANGWTGTPANGLLGRRIITRGCGRFARA